MIKRIPLSVLLIFILVSCNNSNTNSSSTKNLSYKVIIKNSVSIPIEMDEFFRSYQNHVVEKKDSTFIYRESRFFRSVNIYNWDSRKEIKSIHYRKEGPNAIRSLDFAAFIPLHKERILIANLLGEFYITKEDSVLFYKRTSLRLVGKNSVLPEQVDSKIFMQIASDVTQKEAAFKTRPLIGFYNIKEDTLKVADIKYPEFLTEHCWTEQQFGTPFTLNNKKQLIITFPQIPNIYVYNITKNEVVDEVTAKSQFVKSIPPYKACDWEDDERYFSYLKSVAQYRSLTYDQYKDVYYRIVMLPQEGKPNGQRNQDIVMPFSIMVLDNKFNVLAERKFPAKTYDVVEFFVTKKGLWLSTNNEGNKSFNENELAYDLIGFEEK